VIFLLWSVRRYAPHPSGISDNSSTPVLLKLSVVEEQRKVPCGDDVIDTRDVR